MKTLVELDHRLKSRKIEDLIDLPVVISVSEFTDESAESFSKEMRAAHLTGQPVIPVTINSNGGYCYVLRHMVAEIESATVPVATICTGQASSCAAILLACGTKGYRFCGPRAGVMLHDTMYGGFDKTTDHVANAKQAEREKREMFEMLARKCGRHPQHFLQELKQRSNSDWYLTAREAKREGLVDHLRLPAFKVSIKVEVDVE